jgi:hypothetical protein
MGNLLILTQSCADAGSDSRKLAEVLAVICQAESSLINRETEHPRSSEIGLAQQNKLFGQRDSKGHWKQHLSKEERLDIKACVMRSYRILTKEQMGDGDWRYKELGQTCYELQRCELEHKSIYFNQERINVARTLARKFYPNHLSMLDNVSPRSQNNNHSSATISFAERYATEPQYTGPVGKLILIINLCADLLTLETDPISLVDQCKVMGLDSSFESRAEYGQTLGISGNPGSTKYNLNLLNELRRQ